MHQPNIKALTDSAQLPQGAASRWPRSSHAQSTVQGRRAGQGHAGALRRGHEECTESPVKRGQSSRRQGVPGGRSVPPTRLALISATAWRWKQPSNCHGSTIKAAPGEPSKRRDAFRSPLTGRAQGKGGGGSDAPDKRGFDAAARACGVQRNRKRVGGESTGVGWVEALWGG